MDKTELDHVVKASNEFYTNFKDAAELVRETNEGLKEVSQLYDHGHGGAGKSLISLGFALFMFPEPTMISDVIGCGIMAAGFLYNKVSPPPIFIDDIFKTIEEQVRSLHDTGENLSRNFYIPLDLSSMRFDI